MASAVVTLSVLLLAHSSYALWWLKTENEWSENVPANCPREDVETHVCYSLVTQNSTCIVAKCCAEFRPWFEKASELSLRYKCRICYRVVLCTTFRCYNRCCDGYIADTSGRCQNKTGRLLCLNGGIFRWDDWGNVQCECPSGFSGRNCEIPICHCENLGECMINDSVPYCKCSDGYQGERCEQSRCNITCENGGQCYQGNGYEVCDCPRQYIGEQCETLFEQSDQCPNSTTYGKFTARSCLNDDGCSSSHHCCFDGHGYVCKGQNCTYESGSNLVTNYEDVIQVDACTTCKCFFNGAETCQIEACLQTKCSDGKTALQVPGQCCPLCANSSSYKPPVISGCSFDNVFVNTTCYEHYAVITDSIAGVTAVDGYGKKIKVEYYPRQVIHCNCYQQRTVEITATATDDQGVSVHCSFFVIVEDACPPRYSSCPIDVYAFDDEVVHWVMPSYYDNVHIAEIADSGHQNHVVYPVGTHKIEYRIMDFGRNIAQCTFYVHVVDRDTPKSMMPQGLLNRYNKRQGTDLVKLFIIMVACLPVIMFAILLMVWYRHYKTSGDLGTTDPPFDLAAAYGNTEEFIYQTVAPSSITNLGYGDKGLDEEETTENTVEDDTK